jgi:hypothetical protein
MGTLTGLTVCVWARINAVHAGNLFHPIMRIAAASGSAMILGFKGTNGRTPSLYSGSSTTGISGAEQALSTDVFIACTMNAGPAAIFYGNTPGGPLTKVTGTVNTTGTPDTITLFSRAPADGTEWLEGVLSHVRVWSGTLLTDAEIAAESGSGTAVKAGAWSAWEMVGASLLDSSANARHLTAGTTALASAADPIGRSLALGFATETDAALAPGRTRRRTLSIAAETDTALAAGRVRLRALGLATEIDGALAPGHRKARTLGIAAETDTALAPTRTRARTLGLASETDMGLTPTHRRSRTLAVAVETAAALASTRVRSRVLGLAAEASQALAPGRVRARLLGLATELSQALAATHRRALTLGRATETDLALSPGTGRQQALGLAVETSLALLPGHRRARGLQVGVEWGQALAMVREEGPWPPESPGPRPVPPLAVGAPGTRVVVASGPRETLAFVVGTPRVLH